MLYSVVYKGFGIPKFYEDNFTQIKTLTCQHYRSIPLPTNTFWS